MTYLKLEKRKKAAHIVIWKSRLVAYSRLKVEKGHLASWKSRLVAYGAALERRFIRKGIVGSNPTSSAAIYFGRSRTS